MKESVSSGTLKEIVKDLEYAIFGPSKFDDKKDDDEDGDNFQESIAERVKKKEAR